MDHEENQDTPAVLFVDDEENVLYSLKRLFLDEPYRLFTASSGSAGLELLGKEVFAVIVSDQRMPEMSGSEFLARARTAQPDAVRIVLTGYADTASVLSAVNDGQIYRFIPKPWNDDELKIAVSNAVERYRLQKRNDVLTEHLLRKSEEFKKLNMALQWLITEKTSDMTFQSGVFELFRNVFQELPSAAICINTAGHIIQSNRKAKELLACRGCGGVGRERASSLPEELNRFIDEVFARKALSGSLAMNGRRLSAHGAVVNFSPAEGGVVLVISDTI